MKIEEKFINLLSLAIPFMVIMMLVVVISRYVFGIGQTGLQELIMYMHGLVFLVSAGYLVTKDEHVRVDIFYRDASKEYKHKLNVILGILFLLPVILGQHIDQLGLQPPHRKYSKQYCAVQEFLKLNQHVQVLLDFYQ